MRLFFSNTVTEWPARASCCAQARPAGPEPTTATFLPVLRLGGSAVTQPSFQPLSIMACSMDLMPIASSLMFRVQAASQGAGQMRPVNSGKLLVEWSTSSARAQSCLYTRSLKSGMMLFTGQPVIQKGMPQSMQRAPCTLASSSESVITNSFQCFTRSLGASCASERRSNSRNPVTLPIVLFLRQQFDRGSRRPIILSGRGDTLLA